ncbi:MAG: RusA family crossover junction endodeoxyribonuclease [Bacteroides sp.]|nr:RusA family crossover junction endodeoxyribonuclease [Bacteroides sp.]
MDSIKKYDRQVIEGQPPSKSNTYKVIIVGEHYRLGKTKATKKYEENFFMQCSLRGMMISRRFRLKVDVYNTSDRPDLDNALKIVLDCLQASGSIKNDRLCAEIHARKLIDRNRPRIEFEIEEIF